MERYSGVGMLLAQDFLAYGQGLLVVKPRRRVIFLKDSTKATFNGT